ncbi:MAG: RNA pseudouridine synthase [Hyphomicrobiaceae bacterium]|nr:RNA pseudouridine synthase [Hyphomicrobiaceae bacterium]
MQDDGERTFVVTVDPVDDGRRLDAVLARNLSELSRSRVQALIQDGHVRLGGRTIGDRNARVKPGDVIEIDVPKPAPARPAGEAIALDVVYEDAQLLVIDKPAGLVVHPAAGHAAGTLVNALIAHCGDSLSGIGGVRRPGIVHRLDKETSGLLVVAKTDIAHRSLSEQFAAHGRDGRLHRAYIAVCWRVPDRVKGAIDAPLARSTHNRTKIAVSNAESAREAITHYEVVEQYPPTGVPGNAGRRRRGLPAAAQPTADLEGPLAALLRLELETGRTHQIRVHMAHIGHPLLGDNVYGAGFKSSVRKLSPQAEQALSHLGRQALHAAELGFEHPLSGEAMHFESPLPPDLQRLIDALRQLPV